MEGLLYNVSAFSKPRLFIFDIMFSGRQELHFGFAIATNGIQLVSKSTKCKFFTLKLKFGKTPIDTNSMFST
jgi:hypothetical protein